MIQTIPAPVLAGTVFFFGLAVGSFVNTYIHSLLPKKSAAVPEPHRPTYSVHPRNDIAVVRGEKIRDCATRAASVFPVVETVTAVLLLAGFFEFGLSFDFIVYAVVASALVIVTVVDIARQIIPDAITLPGIVFGLAAGTYTIGYANSLLGFFAGCGLFYLLAVLSDGGVGGGDIKYIAAAGALLGWQKVLLIIFLATFAGAVVGVFQIAAQKKSSNRLIPFGPFLAAGTLVTLFYGNAIIRLYADYLGG